MTIIQSLWIGERLSTLEHLSVKSFLDNGHSYHLYCYGEVANVPPAAVQKDANVILPESDIFTYSSGSPAAFANWFRYEMLHRTGNFWVDTDVICLKPFDFEAPIVFGYEEEGRINNAVLKFPPGHELCRFMAHHCSHPNRFLPWDGVPEKRLKLKRRFLRGNRRGNVRWGEYGPEAFSRAVRHFDLQEHAVPAPVFYPVGYLGWNAIFDDSPTLAEDRLSASYAVHYWNEMTRQRDGFDKDARFPDRSLIERLKERYQVPNL